ncbi:MAG: DUF4214 domain-containing protein, partial [Ignavibacteriales bacterium]
RDDTIGGDTNGDGSASSPAEGGDGILVTQGSVTMKYCTVKYKGIRIENSTGPNAIINSVISNNRYGIYILGSNPNIYNNKIYSNSTGIYCDSNANPIIGGSIVNSNRIYQNTYYGVRNNTATVTVNARYNWWGDSSGPFNASNPNGLGDKVSTYVDFRNYINNINPVTINSFTPDKSSPQKADTTITWTCGATGGSTLQYQYRVRIKDGEWEIAQPYSTTNTWAWTPTIDGTYEIEVWVKEVGWTNEYDKNMVIEYTILVPNTQAIEDFVTRFYQLCLLRDPDTEGLTFWTNNLVNQVQTGADVARGFIFSDEFIARNLSDDEYLDIMYHAFFNRDPDADGKSFWLNCISSGTSRLEVLAGFVNSDEFNTLCSSYGITRGSIDTTEPVDPDAAITDFVTRFYQECLSREPDTDGLNFWVDTLKGGSQTGANLANEFIFSDEFIARNVTDDQYLDIMYSAFFDRVADTEGKAFWISLMSSGTSRLEVLAGFVNSPEFETLCSEYGIVRGEINVNE